jgi:predicted RNA-binding protein
MTRYFIGVVSKEHVLIGVKESIAQIGHGKKSGLARMHKGDWLIYYSPKVALNSDEKLQAFTAIGQMVDDDIYQVEMSPTFKPFRRKVAYSPSHDIPIAPLIEKLSFITNKSRWGYVFRYGLVEIPKEDFELIKNAMHD